MNHSQLDNTGVLRTDAIACPNCRSNEFYRDAQSGMVCIHCGLEMPNFLLESQEEAGQGGDGADITFGARHLLRTTQKKKVMRSTFRAPLLDLLSIYQYCLILMTKELAHLLATDEGNARELEDGLLQSMKSLWSSYLSKWQSSSSPCKIEGIFCKQFYNKTDNRFCVCSDLVHKLNHPVFPTKPLLLGFLGLVVRLHRLTCIPADLVRFCDRGLLTYHNLWDALPLEVRQPIEHSQYTRFFTKKHSGRLTPMNIWHHITSLASSLEVSIPPLNTPALALAFINSLGFPEDDVWSTYVQLSHLLEPDIAPLSGLEATDVDYPEQVMVMVLLSCMLCSTWTEWSLSTYTALTEIRGAKKTDIEAVPSPVDLIDLDQELSRQLLPIYLKQSRLVLSDVQRRHYQLDNATATTLPGALRPINRVVLHLLEKLNLSPAGDVPPDLFPSSSSTSSSTSTAVYSAALAPEKVAYSNRFVFHQWLSPQEKTYLRMVDGRPTRAIQQPRVVSCATENQRDTQQQQQQQQQQQDTQEEAFRFPALPHSQPLRHFTSHARHAEDVSGHRSVVATLLLERAAKYLYVSPLLLRHGLDTLDRQIACLIVDEQGNVQLQPEVLTTHARDTPDQEEIDVSFVYHDTHVAERVAAAAQATTTRQRLRRRLHRQLRDTHETPQVLAQDAETQMYAKYRDKTTPWLSLLHELYLTGEFDALVSSSATETPAETHGTRDTAERQGMKRFSDDNEEDESTDDDEEEGEEEDSTSGHSETQSEDE